MSVDGAGTGTVAGSEPGRLLLDSPEQRSAYLALETPVRRARLASGDRAAYVAARDWSTELIASGRAGAALVVLEDLLAVAGATPFARADVLRALRRVRPPLDVPGERIRAHVDAALRDVEQRPSLLRVVPDLVRYAAQVLFALGDRDGVVRAVDLARVHGARLARGYGAGPLERIRDDVTLAPMWAHPRYREAFAHLPPPVFTDAEVAVTVADQVRHLRLARPARLPPGMDRLVNVEVVELAGPGDATTAGWLAWLARRPSLHTLELSGAAQRLVEDEDLLAALLIAPGLRRLRIGYPPVNPWSMRVLLSDLRRIQAPPRTRLLHLALLREDLDYVVARARTADLVAALDSAVAAVRATALHVLDGVFGAPAVRFSPGDEVLVSGRPQDGAGLTAAAEGHGLRLASRPSARTRIAVIAERHGGAALDLLEGGPPLVCEGQLRAMLETAPGSPRPPEGTSSRFLVDVGAFAAREPAVSRALASTDGAQVGAELARLTSSRTRSGAFEGLIVVATNPHVDRSLRQAARRLLARDAPADLVEAVEDVVDVVRTLDRTGVLSTWELQETGVETDGLVDVVELAVLLMSVRRQGRAHRLDIVRTGLERLPDDVGQLQHLRELRLDDNLFTEVPAVVAVLRGLTRLSLAGNRLRTLPAALESLTGLERLDLGHNRFSDLPAVVGRLPALRSLVLDGHELAELPPVLRGLPGLERLSLRHGRLGALPGWLAELPRLHEVALDGTPIGDPAGARAVVAALERRGVTVGMWLPDTDPVAQDVVDVREESNTS